MIKYLLVLVALLAGCASTPTPKGLIAGLAVVAVLAVAASQNDSDDDNEPARSNCYFVVGPNGSNQICP